MQHGVAEDQENQNYIFEPGNKIFLFHKTLTVKLNLRPRSSFLVYDIVDATYNKTSYKQRFHEYIYRILSNVWNTKCIHSGGKLNSI